ncbi:hypothetical protein [Paenibacillus sp. NEAU-GSW1]|uniref:hypothetical protein n=1 Tax=Paenibacillus sp. NEAU-GSW1 TaxID=2682486 RepID=UPI0012E24FB1|nr:hypothetical protein [Paenibacillus sp. NEAU-GSW1]MUT64558.1 hypothetical protein [Paenibacillus sp. NEAU-GSW1]
MRRTVRSGLSSRVTDKPVTPEHWECLDGTLHIDDEGRPWTQDAETLFPQDGGHGMLFRTFEGKLMLTMHAPNQQPLERAVFIEVEERDGTLVSDSG